jgi:cell division inhibitor SepF
MGFSDLWSRTLVYFGIAEDEEWDDNGYVTNEELEDSYRRRDRRNVRRLPNAVEEDDWAPEDTAASRSRRRQESRGERSERTDRSERPTRLRSVDPGPPATVHLVVPRRFNDAQQIADRFKAQGPVIINLQGADTDLAKRVIDFASGLTYALDGSMQRVADKVFLLTPHNVELSAEERARALERGGFYNQS